MSLYEDSAGKPISIGSRVRFRGYEFTIKGFRHREGSIGTSAIEFEEPIEHTSEIPDEISVDLITRDLISEES